MPAFIPVNFALFPGPPDDLDSPEGRVVAERLRSQSAIAEKQAPREARQKLLTAIYVDPISEDGITWHWNRPSEAIGQTEAWAMVYLANAEYHVHCRKLDSDGELRVAIEKLSMPPDLPDPLW